MRQKSAYDNDSSTFGSAGIIIWHKRDALQHGRPTRLLKQTLESMYYSLIVTHRIRADADALLFRTLDAADALLSSSRGPLLGSLSIAC